MDHMIATALREHAEGEIHIERLLDAVRTGARRQRRRRLAVGCGAALAVVALIGAVALAAAPGRQPDPVTARPGPAGFPRPPAFPAVITAADAPEVLGSTPALFHLDLVDPAGWRFASWAAAVNFEELTVHTSNGIASVSAARDPQWLGEWGTGVEPATVHGLPAEASTVQGGKVVRWQPRPGLWAQVWVDGSLDSAVALAGNVRFDHVFRCAVPFRLTGLAPTRLTKCSTDIERDTADGSVRTGGTVWFGEPGGPEFQVSVGRSRSDTAVNDTVAGRAVQVVPDGKPPEIRYPYDGVTAYFWVFGTPLSDALRPVVAAFRPVSDPDPARWPASPFAD